MDMAQFIVDIILLAALLAILLLYIPAWFRTWQDTRTRQNTHDDEVLSVLREAEDIKSGRG